jgi:hypothetical protein
MRLSRKPVKHFLRDQLARLARDLEIASACAAVNPENSVVLSHISPLRKASRLPNALDSSYPAPLLKVCCAKDVP